MHAPSIERAGHSHQSSCAGCLVRNRLHPCGQNGTLEAGTLMTLGMADVVVPTK